MDSVFVNLPLDRLDTQPALFRRFLDQGLSPELGLDGLDLFAPRTLELVEQAAQGLHRAGLPCTVHLPFTGLWPGSPDPRELAGTRLLLARAAELAQRLSPRRLVGHPFLHRATDPRTLARAVTAAAATWRDMLARWPGHPVLCLENTHETSPGPLAALMAEMGEPGVGLCFDVGHWHGFAGGAARGDLDHWVRTLAPRIRHLHLHDNDGSGDQHLGLGLGRIDWAAFFALMEECGIAPTMTLEPHTEEDFAASAAFAAAHPRWFTGRGRPGC